MDMIRSGELLAVSAADFSVVKLPESTLLIL